LDEMESSVSPLAGPRAVYGDGLSARSV
jgi:hypothetical protein